MSVNPKQKKLLSIISLAFLIQTNTTPAVLSSAWPVAEIANNNKIIEISAENINPISLKVKHASGTEIVTVGSIEEAKPTAEISAVVTKKLTKEEIKEYVLNEIRKAGLNPLEAEKIIHCESRWDDQAVNDKNRNGSNDLGLWQINSIHRKQISDEGRLDYKTATQWAIEKRLRDGNWSAWVCARKLAIR
jgi:hypothetical protein